MGAREAAGRRTNGSVGEVNESGDGTNGVAVMVALRSVDEHRGEDGHACESGDG